MGVQGANQHLRVYVSQQAAALAPDGSVFDLGSETPGAGAVATGTAALAGGSGSVDGITVGGVQIMSNPDATVTFASSVANTFSTNTAQCTSVIATNTCTVNGLLYTAVAGAKVGNEQFSIDTGDNECAADLADSINNDERAGTLDPVSAIATTDTVALTSSEVGVAGNPTTLAQTGGTITLGGATFSGGVDADVIVANNLTYTAVAGAVGNFTQFSIDTGDTETATSFAAAIQGDVRVGTSGDVSATSALGVVTLVSSLSGAAGAAITLTENTSSSTIVISNATFAGELFDTNINTTAAAVAANITANTSVPNYSAVAVATNIVTISAITEGSWSNGFAVVTTLTTLTSTDGDMAGGAGDGLVLTGITYYNHSTQSHVATPPTGGVKYNVVYKDLNGTVYYGPTIDDSMLVQPISTKSYVAAVQQADLLTIPATPTAGVEYVIKLRVPEYGGLLGSCDEVFFYGNYTVVANDTATLVAAGLTASLKKATDKAPKAFVLVTSAAAIITVTGVAQEYVKAKFDAKVPNFDLSLVHPTSLQRGKNAAGNTLRVVGSGTYPQVASAEEFFAGYNTDYKNRGADWPADGNPSLAAQAAGTYDSITIIFNTTVGGANLGHQRQTILLFFKQ